VCRERDYAPLVRAQHTSRAQIAAECDRTVSWGQRHVE
jgi:hypothetical protein